MDESVFSLVPAADKTNLVNNTAETMNTSVPRILKVAGIYGANASGKSNLVKAMQLMRAIVAQSACFNPISYCPRSRSD